MKILKHISKGTQHKVFCEDFIIDEVLDENYRILGVFDGCSSGKDSHFASALLGKITVSASKELINRRKKIELKEIIFQTIIKMKSLKNELELEIEELLSTIIFMLVNTKNRTASITVIGDGFVSINNDFINIDQNNQPDYITYHLDSINSREEFEIFYSNILKFNNINISDISISTDGINSFIKNSSSLSDGIDIVKYFVQDKYLIGNKSMLARKHNILRNKYAYDNLDDIAIIRIVK